MDGTTAAVAAAHPTAKMSSQKMSNGTGGVAVHGTFAPSVWGDFFITYVPPVAQAGHIYSVFYSLVISVLIISVKA
jgi:hypothetical protein